MMNPIQYLVFRTPRRETRHALTLVELLVVMAIITIIVSSITVAAYSVYKLNQKKATESLFETVAAALEQYHDVHSMYVPTTYIDPNDGQEKVCNSDNDSTFLIWKALEYDGGYKLSVKNKFKELGSTFENSATGAEIRGYYYVDSWKVRILYECRRPYTRCRLRSRGPDTLANTGDDIEKEAKSVR